MIRRHALLGLLALAAPARAEAGIAGLWGGHYVCTQGNTAMTLSVSAPKEGGRVVARYRFWGPPDNPDVPDGCYELEGQYDEASRRLLIAPLRWLRRPEGYVMVALDGRLSPDGGVLAGEVMAFGCGDFRLARISHDPAPEACRRDPLLSLL